MSHGPCLAWYRSLALVRDGYLYVMRIDSGSAANLTRARRGVYGGCGTRAASLTSGSRATVRYTGAAPSRFIHHCRFQGPQGPAHCYRIPQPACDSASPRLFAFPAVSVYYSTGVGERQIVALPDRSTITLNTASKLAVTYDHHTRIVRLMAGEALFKVHYDAGRPFRVIADDVFIEDMGTEFDVYRRPTSTRISVLEGEVQLTCSCTIAPASSSSAAESLSPPHVAPTQPSAVIVLRRRRQAKIDFEGHTSRLTEQVLSANQINQSVSWVQGQLWFNGEPRSEVIEEFNRYNQQHVIIADPAIANYRIGGMYRAWDVKSFVATLEHLFGITPLQPNPVEPTTIRLGRTHPSKVRHDN